MIIYCSKCGINWHSLWNDESGEDAVEFCPECSTDTFLEDGNDIVAYIKCKITGMIINTTTGLTWQQDHPVPFKKPVYRVKLNPVKETNEQRQAREDAAIDAYIASDNQAIYFSTIKKVK